ncbi:hypothetical protein BpHYR1_027965 [Brachionus plicatilis]|uniref:Secreted protein n=1 Tax=Brachionus plicatilis TaxID=10195 RepID=A0A3M7QTK2_BRAPC|nr:hypothetical protein BpHYR1_027965 [Brachionus plicatilis]
MNLVFIVALLAHFFAENIHRIFLTKLDLHIFLTKKNKASLLIEKKLKISIIEINFNCIKLPGLMNIKASATKKKRCSRGHRNFCQAKY